MLDERADDRLLVAGGSGHAVLRRQVCEHRADRRRRDHAQLVRRHCDLVARLEHPGQYAEVAPLDATLLDQPHRQIDAERLLALEAQVEEVDRLGAEIADQRSVGRHLCLVDAERLDDELAHARLHLRASPDLRGVRFHALAGLLSRCRRPRR